MSTARESVIEFIDRYRELECLWKVTHKDYKDKHKRSRALELLVETMMKSDPHSSFLMLNNEE